MGSVPKINKTNFSAEEFHTWVLAIRDKSGLGWMTREFWRHYNETLYPGNWTYARLHACGRHLATNNRRRESKSKQKRFKSKLNRSQLIAASRQKQKECCEG